MINEIRELVRLSGVSGNEAAVAEYIKGQILPYVDKVYDDALGNLVAIRKGEGPKVMLMAHMDEIGLVATFADEKGFIRVAAAGGVDPRTTIGRPVQFENGVMGVFTCGSKAMKELKLGDCFIDIGAKSREEALRRIEIGMTACFLSETFETGNCIVSNALDNRVGCYCLMETLRRIKNTTCEVYAVFTVQEEVGLRGAKVSGFEISPDVAIAVDVTLSGDYPDTAETAAALGKGTAIKIRDRSAICSREIVEDLENLAARKGISAQRDVLSGGGTDIGSVQLLGKGVQVGGLSIPIRYCHSAIEMADRGDVEATIGLLTAYLEK
ncbi:MAG: M20/M25/M40 family metallo-hydrolase [Clostridia bacterium]|nr:M20/M25/M40 family metallo-hydrolase [Clostridia bacterium]